MTYVDEPNHSSESTNRQPGQRSYSVYLFISSGITIIHRRWGPRRRCVLRRISVGADDQSHVKVSENSDISFHASENRRTIPMRPQRYHASLNHIQFLQSCKIGFFFVLTKLIYMLEGGRFPPKSEVCAGAPLLGDKKALARSRKVLATSSFNENCSQSRLSPSSLCSTDPSDPEPLTRVMRTSVN